MRVEGRGGQRRGLVALQEGRVGLDAGDLVAVEVEDFD